MYYHFLGQLDKRIPDIVKLVFELWYHVTFWKTETHKRFFFVQLWSIHIWVKYFELWDEFELNIFWQKLDILQNIGP